jgi:predicted Zn-dependent protease
MQCCEAWELAVERGLRVCMVLLLVSGSALTQEPSRSDNFEDLLRRGFELHQREQYSQALSLLEKAWTLHPDDYFVNLLLGIDLLRTGKTADSIRYLKAAARVSPQDEIPYAYLGEADAKRQDFADAALAFAQAVEVAPTSLEATLALVDYSLERFATLAIHLRNSKKGLAAAYRLQAVSLRPGDPTRRDWLLKSVELDPSSPGAWSELALEDLAANDGAAAEKSLQRALQAGPEDLDVWLAQAALAAVRGDWATAAQRLNDVAKRSPAALAIQLTRWPQRLQPPDDAAVSGAAAQFLQCAKQASCNSRTLRGTLPAGERAAKGTRHQWFREQRWEQVAALPEPALGQASAWFERGTALARLQECGKAIPALERSLPSGDSSVEAMYLLSSCYARQAGRVADRLQQGSDDAVVRMMRGDIMLRLAANPAGAIAEYQAALASRKNDPGVWERLAEAQMAAGHMDDAKQSAEAALRLDEHRYRAKSTLANVALEQRDYAAALPYLRQLLTHDPQDLTTRVELGTACAKTGALAEAFRNLSGPLEQGYPDEKGSLHYLLGTVLHRLGRGPEAAAAFATARQLSENFSRTTHRDQDAQR